jgi:Xaa-Pro aminopeptidase
MLNPQQQIQKPAPFDTARLDELMGEAGIDVLVATSKHNVQYLLGGYRFFFFESMDAIGVSRYLPVFIYRRGHPEDTAYIGYRMESFEKRLDKFWPATVMTTSNGTQDAMRLAAERIKSFGSDARRIGVERAFIPADAEAGLHQALPQATIVDALFPLERLRARKSAAELALLREASDRVVAAMLATFDACRPGMTKSQLVETLRQEEVKRGLTFDYCLITVGTDTNRAPSDQRIAEGDILSLDSGGNYHGYIGDLCRMGILGEPDAELEDLLGVIETVQMHARKPIKAGSRGGDIFDAAEKVLAESSHRKYMEFLAHGMGLVSHEAPRLTDKGPVPYEAHDAELPLESGMVVSVESTMLHPTRGFIKLEDTVVVTDTGHQGLGDAGRGWNHAGRG